VSAAPLRQRCLSAGDTEEFGAALVRARPPGDALAVVYLRGDLGAGKTTLVRGALRALGVPGAVRSPTYTLLEPYGVGLLTVVHADLYRLRDASELEPLGLRDFAAARHLWFIEWPDRGAGRLPPPDLDLVLSAASDGHSIELTSGSQTGDTWLDNLRQALARPPLLEKGGPRP